ncbi:unnamed protein product, partial [Rhizoctonia solani]
KPQSITGFWIVKEFDYSFRASKFSNLLKMCFNFMDNILILKSGNIPPSMVIVGQRQHLDPELHTGKLLRSFLNHLE